MAYPRYARARSHRQFTRTAGDLTLNSAAWANLPTIGTTFDIVLEAQVGDTIEAGIKGCLGTEAFGASLDVVTIVSAAYFSSFSTQSTARPSTGGAAWRGPASVEMTLAGSIFYTVVTGDITAGQVTLRAQYSQASAGNKTLYAGTVVAPFQVWARCIGPADPE